MLAKGINPDYSGVYNASAGEIDRINPCHLLALMKERGVYNKTVERIRSAMGSVLNEDWLTGNHEKEVFQDSI